MQNHKWHKMFWLIWVDLYISELFVPHPVYEALNIRYIMAVNSSKKGSRLVLIHTVTYNTSITFSDIRYYSNSLQRLSVVFSAKESTAADRIEITWLQKQTKRLNQIMLKLLMSLLWDGCKCINFKARPEISLTSLNKDYDLKTQLQ